MEVEIAKLAGPIVRMITVENKNKTQVEKYQCSFYKIDYNTHFLYMYKKQVNSFLSDNALFSYPPFGMYLSQIRCLNTFLSAPHVLCAVHILGLHIKKTCNPLI